MFLVVCDGPNALMLEIMMPLVDSLFEMQFERPRQKAQIVGSNRSTLLFQRVV